MPQRWNPSPWKPAPVWNGCATPWLNPDLNSVIQMTNPQALAQLQMIWPRQRLADPPSVSVAPGYRLRTYRPDDESRFYKVMEIAGFEGWNDEILRPWLAKILPDGWFFVIEETTGVLVATTMATHNPTDGHSFGGELGWVASDLAHKGRGLGMTVCAAVVNRFLSAGYRNIYLKTDDFRLPAIKTYLQLGFVPLLFAADMHDRWQRICDQLNWPFAPADWPTARDYHLEVE
ncbi:MAG: GNAT family N-acetyltransferase [Caldilineaceae bacterium]|nr:GNAT family N-acetyltransferase [Caldilineaceae bacterium]